MTDCPLCLTVASCEQQNFPLLIHEFTCSFWVFGSHQFYPGYSVLLLKEHARELYQLPENICNGVWQELMQVGAAVAKVFQPWKLNYASYGNQVEHIHWHIFPRYADEPTRKECPFVNSAQFVNYPADIQKLIHQREALRAQLLTNKK